jgi:hypothetical protein
MVGSQNQPNGSWMLISGGFIADRRLCRMTARDETKAPNLCSALSIALLTIFDNFPNSKALKHQNIAII